MKSLILQPALALIIWTLIVWFWMYATRLPAIKKARPDFNRVKNGAQLRQTLPEKINWAADNYNHLHEQPTLFYALCFMIALSAPENSTALTLAWVYTCLRIGHSLWQIFVNQVPIRFVFFISSSLVLIVMAGLAALNVF